MTLTMGAQSTAGWYRVNGLSYQGKGTAGWDMQSQGLSIANSGWIEASSWQDAVTRAVSGTTQVMRTHGPLEGQTISHGFGGGSFVLTEDGGQKRIALEDSYNNGNYEIEADYNDFYWGLDVEIVQPEVSVEAAGFADEMVPGRSGTFTFTRTGSTDFALPVTVSLAGSASNGTDYPALPTSLQFAVGQSTVEWTVTAAPDEQIEGEETVQEIEGGRNLLLAFMSARRTVRRETVGNWPAQRRWSNSSGRRTPRSDRRRPLQRRRDVSR